MCIHDQGRENEMGMRVVRVDDFFEREYYTINTSVSSGKEWVQTWVRVQHSQRLDTTLDVMTAGATKREAVLALYSD